MSPLQITRREWVLLLLATVHIVLHERDQAKPHKLRVARDIVTHPDLGDALRMHASTRASRDTFVDLHVVKRMVIHPLAAELIDASLNACQAVFECRPDGDEPRPCALSGMASDDIVRVTLFGNAGIHATATGRSQSTHYIHVDYRVFVDALSVVGCMETWLRAEIIAWLPPDAVHYDVSDGQRWTKRLVNLREVFNDACDVLWHYTHEEIQGVEDSASEVRAPSASSVEQLRQTDPSPPNAAYGSVDDPTCMDMSA